MYPWTHADRGVVMSNRKSCAVVDAKELYPWTHADREAISCGYLVPVFLAHFLAHFVAHFVAHNPQLVGIYVAHVFLASFLHTCSYHSCTRLSSIFLAHV